MYPDSTVIETDMGTDVIRGIVDTEYTYQIVPITFKGDTVEAGVHSNDKLQVDRFNW